MEEREGGGGRDRMEGGGGRDGQWSVKRCLILFHCQRLHNRQTLVSRVRMASLSVTSDSPPGPARAEDGWERLRDGN